MSHTSVKDTLKGVYLFLHVLDDVVGFSASVVVGHIAVAVDLHRRVARHACSARNLLLLSCVDLCESDRLVQLGKDLGSLLVLRCEALAVTTPGCVELNKDQLFLCDKVGPVRVGGNQNRFVLCPVIYVVMCDVCSV